MSWSHGRVTEEPGALASPAEAGSRAANGSEDCFRSQQLPGLEGVAE